MLAHFNPYFQVRLRFHDPAPAHAVGRPIDVCYEVTAAGERAPGIEAFTGAIRQRISSVDNDIGVDVNGPTIGHGRSYGGSGVRAPN